MMNKAHDPAVAALDELLELVVLFNEDIQQGLAREGLSVPRAHLLWLLYHGGPSTQRALSDGLRVTPRNVTGLVDGLVETGFVTREQHPGDRRATLVTLTEHGTATLAAMDESHRQLARLLFGDMPELDGFRGGLDHVLARLREATRR